MVFSHGVRLKITESKIALTSTGYDAIFPRNSKTKNQPVKLRVSGTQVQCYFPKKEARNHPVKNSVKVKQDTTLFCEEVIMFRPKW